MRDYRNRYAVVTVYNEDDGVQPLAHVIEVYNTPKAAMKHARGLVKELVDNYNDDLTWRRESAPDGIKFIFEPFTVKGCWEEVDNGERNWLFRDWGFDPIDHCFNVRIRVVTWEEPIKKGNKQ